MLQRKKKLTKNNQKKAGKEPVKVYLTYLGCDKNRVDSEEMLGILQGPRFRLTQDPEEAKAAVVNTCCFIDDAKKESIDVILSLAQLKRKGNLKVLIVAGCMAQRYKEEITELIPEVDAVVGTGAFGRIGEALQETLSRKKNKKRIWLENDGLISFPIQKRVLTENRYSAYLRIADGCDKHCTYCIIPALRGSYRSVPMERLMEEAQELAKQGVKELNLVAQETTLYGTDLYGKKTLPDLVTKLSWITGLKWIRLLYCYPEEITPELIGVMKNNPKILPYIDLPIQHASDRILKLMGRRTSHAELVRVIGELRREIPDICIRTTLISGFPGETEEDHRILCDFVREMKFDRLGVFPYSKEEGTPAAKMGSQVPARIKRKRRDELMRIQQGIAFGQAAARKGRTVTALVEGRLADREAFLAEQEDTLLPSDFPDDGNVYVARTEYDAPEIDGMIFFESSREYLSGDMVKVRITGASGYDLMGECVDEDDESAE